MGGIGIVLPVIGVALAWLALRRGAPRKSSVYAAIANLGTLIVFLAASFVFGGT